MSIPFDHTMPAQAGEVVRLAPLIRRVIAPNGGPFTFTGTCSYIIGRGKVHVIDPGPEDALHIDAILNGLEKGETITQILVTHTHKDHSPGARLLSERTGAPILGCAPHQSARDLQEGEINALEMSNDLHHSPAQILQEGDRVEEADFALTALETPGHTANHLSFALETAEGADILFTGDHVMAWSTSIVAPPDGKMRDYLASLKKLQERGECLYWPGHGGPVREPQRFVRALLHHRHQREAQILTCLAKGYALIPQMVAANYPDLAPALRGAAALSTFAHLENLIETGLVQAEGAATLQARYSLT